MKTCPLFFILIWLDLDNADDDEDDGSDVRENNGQDRKRVYHTLFLPGRCTCLWASWASLCLWTASLWLRDLPGPWEPFLLMALKCWANWSRPVGQTVVLPPYVSHGWLMYRHTRFEWVFKQKHGLTDVINSEQLLLLISYYQSHPLKLSASI